VIPAPVREDDGDGFSFSVVVPTFERRDVVVRSVRALATQRLDEPYEVVVVVDGSRDGTAEALRELRTPFPLRVVEQENEGQARARNRGATLARGRILLFLDDDMEAEVSMLQEHETSHRAGADAVIGHIPLHPDSPRTFLASAVESWADRRAERIAERGGELELDDLLTGQLSVRRDLFWQLGGFDERFTRHGDFGGEDLDFGRRLLESGSRVVFNANAVSRQQYVVTPRQYLRQWRQAGRAGVLLARTHPDQSDVVFRRRERLVYRLVRPVRVPLREAVLAFIPLRPTSARIGRWFFRVRDLEYFRGVREAGGEPARHPVRVLCYHSISDLAGAQVLEPYGTPPQNFRRQLEFLVRRFRLLTADEFARYLRGDGVPRRAVLLTFDDCYEDVLRVAAPILRELNLPALAFAVTGVLGGTNEWDAALGAPALHLLDAEGLRALAESDVAIGSHTRTHRMLGGLSPDELTSEIAGSTADLEALGFEPPFFLSYPYGLHDHSVRETARALGAAGAFTVEPGLMAPNDDPYAIPRIEILRGDDGLRFAFKVFAAGRFRLRRPRWASSPRRPDVLAADG
jgi:glycosyltransferase involved in cell wall biosynthesis